MSEDLRHRFKSKPQKAIKKQEKTDNSIFGIWDEQRRMQAEEDMMAVELAETKRKAKELKKTLRRHQFGETKSVVKDKLYSSTKKLKSWVLTNKKKTLTVSLLSLGILAIFIVWSPHEADPSKTLGTSEENTISVDGSIDVLPEFNILYPTGKDVASLESVTRKAPDGNVIHTFKDTINSIEFELTQQELPDKFKSDQESQLLEVATNFQATKIIQIDDQKVYTGVNENTGIQSVFTIKDDKFISIKALQELTDDDWAAYIISLQ